MNINNTIKTWWPVGALAILTTIVAVRKIQKRKIKTDLLKNLASGEGKSGTIDDYMDKAFSETYWQTYTPRTGLLIRTTANAEEVVKNIKGAFGWPFGMNTDEDALYAIYNSLNSKVQMSQIAAKFKEKYGDSLLDRIKGELSSDSEQEKLTDIIKSKPDATFKS